MLNFKYKCPKCNELITRNDLLATNSEVINYFEEIFNNQEKEYQNKIEKGLKQEYEKNLKIQENEIRNKLILKRNNELEIKNQEINSLKIKFQSHVDNFSINLKNEIIKLELKKLEEINKIKDDLVNQFEKKQAEEIHKQEVIFQNKIKENQGKIENLEKDKENLIEKLHKIEIQEAQRRNINSGIKGHNFESEVQEVLKIAIPIEDKIEKINKGTSRADFFHQIFLDKKNIGNIIYEAKDTKDWGSNWLEKLEKNIFDNKVDCGVLIWKNENNFPSQVEEKYPNIWLVKFENLLWFVKILRYFLREKYYLDLKSKTAQLPSQVIIEKINEFKKNYFDNSINTFQKEIENLEKAETSIDNGLKKIEKFKGNIILLFQKKIKLNFELLWDEINDQNFKINQKIKEEKEEEIEI
jgi:hypothetical protein